MKILGTGLDGLVGSRIVELLKDKYEFKSSSVDITGREKITEKITTSKAPIVLHLAAKTNVDECERDKDRDQSLLNRHSGRVQNLLRSSMLLGDSGVARVRQLTDGAPQNDEGDFRKNTAWAVNVCGTQNVVEACEKSNKKLIYVSTDFVFDGLQEVYNEEDKPDPTNWYGKTKHEGEKIVKNCKTPWIIGRIAYPYRASFERSDFFRGILQKLQKGETVKAVIDHVFTPTFIDDVALAIDGLVKREATGIFHAVGSSFLSPYEAARKIAAIFNLDRSLISSITRKEYFKNRAKRPFQLALKNDKIKNLGVKMRGFEEGLGEVKRQVSF